MQKRLTLNKRGIGIASCLALILVLVAGFAIKGGEPHQQASWASRVVSGESGSAPFDTSTDCFKGVPSYDSWISAKKSTIPWWHPRRVVLTSRFPRAQFDHVRESMMCRTITYKSSGLTVDGWMLSPKRSEKGGLPVVVYNRGGNGPFSAITLESVLYNLAPLADMGFVVLASQYRGVRDAEPGTNGADQFGGSDVDDVLRLVELAAQVEGADPENIFMMGASRGAMMTFLALRRGARVRAVAVIAGVADLAEDLKASPRMEGVYRSRIPGYLADPQSALAERSVVKWAGELPRDVPILMLHGDRDDRVDIHQAYLLKRTLETVGHPHRLVVYRGGDHQLSRHRSEMFQEVNAWFKRSSDTDLKTRAPKDARSEPPAA